MRRATDYEHLDDDGEAEPRYDLAERRQRLEATMSYLQLRYARLGRAIENLADQYGRADDGKERTP
jgi:hypothetical protein